jgi:hypothetical protein
MRLIRWPSYRQSEPIRAFAGATDAGMRIQDSNDGRPRCPLRTATQRTNALGPEIQAGMHGARQVGRRMHSIRPRHKICVVRHPEGSLPCAPSSVPSLA